MTDSGTDRSSVPSQRRPYGLLIVAVLALTPIFCCCLLPPIIREWIPPEWVAGPRPMFGWLAEDNIYGHLVWKKGVSLQDDASREAHFDEELNLVVIIAYPVGDKHFEGGWPECTPQSATFGRDTPDEFTVPSQQNRLVAYARGNQAVDAPLPPDGARKFMDDYFKIERYRKPCDFQAILDRLEIPAKLPVLTQPAIKAAKEN